MIGFYALLAARHSLSGKAGVLTRDEEAMNLVINYSMILMFAFEDAFASLASGMSEALVQGTAAMAGAIQEGLGGSKEDLAKTKLATEKMSKEAKTKTSEEVRKAFSEMREKARNEIKLDDKSMKEIIHAQTFDRGIAIVKKHDFGLPKLTERLSDEDFAAYVALFKKSDPEFVKMSEELSEWRDTLPNPNQSPAS